MSTLRELRFEVLAWLLVSILAAGLIALLRPGRPLLPAPRRRAVPWGLLEVASAVIFAYLWQGIVYELLRRTGFFDAIYGPGHAAEEYGARYGLWLSVCALPLQVGTVLLLLAGGCNTRPYQLGLTSHRWRQNVALGSLGLIFFAPCVLGLYFLVAQGLAAWTDTLPEEHPLTRLAQEGLLPAEWVLLAFAAVVAAPVWEELLFRGVLQRWFAGRPWGGWIACTAALAMAVGERLGRLSEARTLTQGALALAPALFVLLVAPGLLVLRNMGARGVYGTALLFGAVHSFAWPSPVPLFVLGLGLGFLAWRTQSLVGPIVLHSLFNSVACVLMLLLHVAGPEKGSDDTTAVRRPPTVSTSTAVPGASLPRRT